MVVGKLIVIDGLLTYEEQADFKSDYTSLYFDKIDYKKMNSMEETFAFLKMEIISFPPNFDTSNVTDMTGLFMQVKAKVIDISMFDIRNVTHMSKMFYGCYKLKELKLPKTFDASRAITMARMFSDCNLLQEINTKIITRDVKCMDRMFNACISLLHVDLLAFDTSNVTDMYYMFSCCEALTKLDLSSFNTSNVRNMKGMFSDCESLDTIIISEKQDESLATHGFFDTSNAMDMSAMFSDCISLKKFNMKLNTSNAVEMSSMFSRCTMLEDADVSSFTISNDCSLDYMFYKCASLKNVKLFTIPRYSTVSTSFMFDECKNLVNLNTETIFGTIHLYSMFSYCTSLTYIDLSNAGVSHQDASCAFYRCSSLISVKLPRRDTDSIKKMTNAFDRCTSLRYVDITNFIADNIKDMEYMFYKCKALNSFNISKDTIVTEGVGAYDKSQHSFDCQKLVNIRFMFSKCYSMQSINLSSLVANRIEIMDSAFCECPLLHELLFGDINFKYALEDTTNFIKSTSINLLNLRLVKKPKYLLKILKHSKICFIASKFDKGLSTYKYDPMIGVYHLI